MKDKKEKPQVSIAVQEIKVISLSYDDPSSEIKESFNDELVNFFINAHFKWDIRIESFSVLINGAANYRSKDVIINLIKFKCLTTYKIKNLNVVLTALEKGAFNMPDDLMAVLVGSAIAHARGAISEKTKGAFANCVQIPLIPMEDFLKSHQAEDLKKEVPKKKLKKS